MGNYYSLYSKNLGLSGKMVWWSTEPNWSTKLGDLTECLKLTLQFSDTFHEVIAEHFKERTKYFKKNCKNAKMLSFLTNYYRENIWNNLGGCIIIN